MLLAGSSVTALAQAPTVSAPVPSHSADIVKSAFSDAYSSAVKWDKLYGSEHETITINGNDHVEKFAGGWVAIGIGERNVADMNVMHADVYVPNGSISAIRFGFSDYSGGEIYADDYNTNTPGGQWTSVDIPLYAFKGYDFAHMRVLRVTVTGGGEYYLDNVYFYKDASVVDPGNQGGGNQGGGDDNTGSANIPAAPVPTRSASNVKSAFSDAYSSFAKWDKLGYGSVTETLTVNGNDHVQKFNGGWGVMSVGERNVGDMEYLHVDVYTPENGISNIRFGFGDWSGGEKYADAYVTDTPAGKWTSVDIPLSAFGGYDFNHVRVFRFTVTGGGEYYLDNVYFYKEGGEQTGSDMPSAPRPGHNAANVKSAFSDVYESAVKWDWAKYGSETETITINGNDHVQKFKSGWGAMSIGERNVADMEYLHADVYTPEDGISAIRFGFGDWSGGEKYADDYNTSTPAGKWTSVDIPLSAFNGYDFSKVRVFRFTVTGGGEYYLDNVYFYKNVAQQGGSMPSAPTPTLDASYVKSAFSDVYSSAVKWDALGYGSTTETITINGNDHVQKFNGGWGVMSVGERNVADMEYFHADVYTPAQGGISNIRFGFGDWSGGEKYADNYITSTPGGQWSSVDIPLSAFGGYDFAHMRVLRFTVTGGGEYYLDNVYFYNEPETGTIPAAPKPTQPASDVKAFFCDVYPLIGKFEIPNNEEFDRNGLIEIIKLSDDDEVAMITNLNYRVVNLGQRDVSDKGFVHVDYYSPKEGGVTKVCINFTNWNSDNGSAFEIENGDYNYRELTPGKWTSFDIPLSNFKGVGGSDFDFATQMACIRFLAGDGSRGRTLYVDNLYFWGDPGQVIEPGEPEYPEIQDKTDGVLPPMDQPMLGVNLSSASGGNVPGRFGYDYKYPELGDLYYFKAKGTRFLRIPFRAARVVEDITNPTVLDTQDTDALKKVIAEAERLGMWVFLDAHDYAERTTNGTMDTFGNGEYTYERFGQMWGAIAKEFSQYSNIWGYDLQNEPKVGVTTLMPAYQAAIDEIRKYDNNAYIIVEGPNWAAASSWVNGNRPDKNYPEYTTEVNWSYSSDNSPWTLATLNDPQNKLVFQAHGYFDGNNSGTYNNGFEQVDYRSRYLPFLEWCKTNNAKGLMGEFGVPYNEHRKGDPRYMDVLDGALQLFREYQIFATYWCAGEMYDANELTCQPDKNPVYGKYAVEKSTMKVLEKYFTNWYDGTNSGIENVAVSEDSEDAPVYNIFGVRVDENYKGIVIKNGKKYLQR